MLRGLFGNDTYVVDNSLDVVDEAQPGSGGVDSVMSSVSFSLANAITARGQVENLLLTGTGNLGGTGNASGQCDHRQWRGQCPERRRRQLTG